MTDRKLPTRIIETGRVARGAAGQGVGWLQALADRITNLRAKVVTVFDRATTPLREGVPDMVSGELVFKADERRTITIPNFPSDMDEFPSDHTHWISPLLVNPIISAGETYKIPITFPPPGVLEAHNLVVGIEAGFTMFANVNRPGITPLSDYRQVWTDSEGGFVPKDPATSAMQWTWQQQVLGDQVLCSVMPFLPYLWNIVDEKSGRLYSRNWIPHGLLLNTRSESMKSVRNPDGELFEFDVPWLFERDGQVAFLFRPIMDLYQIAAADATFPYHDNTDASVNDKSGGRRFQQATVRVEFHGNRYYTDQDLLRDGAFVTETNEEIR